MKQDDVLRVLVITNEMEDAEQLLSQLRNEGIAVRPCRANDEDELDDLLTKKPLDLALVSTTHQSLSVKLVCDTIQKCGKDVPVVDKTHPDKRICSCGAEFPVCPECDEGWLVERKGRYGKFLSCARYPGCKGKQSIAKSPENKLGLDSPGILPPSLWAKTNRSRSPSRKPR